jgi:uncharacterized Fe-S cluster protein YjdI
MGKRLDALRVAFARPKRTNWKAAYQFEKEQRENAEFLLDTRRKKAALSLEQVREQLRKCNMHTAVLARQLKVAEGSREEWKRLHKIVEDSSRAMREKEAFRLASAKMADPFRPVAGSHAFNSGYNGHPWKCKDCGKGTRSLLHKGHRPMQIPTKAKSDEALAVVKTLPGGEAGVRAPEERSTDGYYISERSLNFKTNNPNRRRAYIHTFTCRKIRTRRDDDTIVVKGDSDYRDHALRTTVAGWLWGADMKEIRSIARTHHKYTKLCSCVSGEADEADNSNGQIGSLITDERGGE